MKVILFFSSLILIQLLCNSSSDPLSMMSVVEADHTKHHANQKFVLGLPRAEELFVPSCSNFRVTSPSCTPIKTYLATRAPIPQSPFQRIGANQHKRLNIKGKLLIKVAFVK